MKQDEVGKCTPGVYLIKGEQGTRVGQSVCAEERSARVAREREGCLGKIRGVEVIPVADRQARLRLEKILIAMLEPKCNPIKA